MANLTTLTKDESDKMGIKSKLNDFTDTLQDAEKNVAGWMEAEGAKLKGVYDQAEKGVSKAVKSLNSTVKQYPVSSVLAGFGVGCLAGYFLRAYSKSE